MKTDAGKAALCLLEALIEHLESENVLTPENVDAIYDRALELARSRQPASGRRGGSGDFLTRPGRRRH